MRQACADQGVRQALLRIGTDPVCSTPQEMAEFIQRLAPVMPDAITLWGATANGGRSRPPRSSSAVAMAHGVTMITGRPQAACVATPPEGAITPERISHCLAQGLDGAAIIVNGYPPRRPHCPRTVHVLAVVCNTGIHAAPRNSALAMCRDGAAARQRGELLADLKPAPAFERYAEASGGHGGRVSDPTDLPAAPRRAIHAVTVEKRQARLNLVCAS